MAVVKIDNHPTPKLMTLPARTKNPVESLLKDKYKDLVAMLKQLPDAQRDFRIENVDSNFVEMLEDLSHDCEELSGFQNVQCALSLFSPLL